MFFVVLAATATGLCTGLGALPFLVVRGVPRRVYDSLLGFGAGLMLSAATIGLLGHALGSLRPAGGPLLLGRLVLVLTGFVGGFGILWLVERIIPHEHAGGHREHLRHGGRRDDADADHAGHDHDDRAAQHRLGVAISGALVFHRLPEGFAIGASFATGETAPLGGLVAIAVALQNVCEGIVSAAPLRAGGVAPLKALGWITASGLTMPVAAALGYLFSRHISGALPFALALGAGSLISVTSNEIIPETHSHGNEAHATVGVVCGFLFTIVLRVVLGAD
ncbi:MAG TPA: ZIP family metal transporter [Polyangia bacterium]